MRCVGVVEARMKKAQVQPKTLPREVLAFWIAFVRCEKAKRMVRELVQTKGALWSLTTDLGARLGSSCGGEVEKVTKTKSSVF